MGSTFSSVYVSYRAMVAAQAGTSVVGNNISNMNTPGYTRQRADLVAQTLSGYKSRFDTHLFTTGNGVAATGVSQIRDSFLDSRYRTECADTGRYEAISAGLADIENVLDEISTTGLQSQFDDFVNQLQNLSQFPTSKDIGLVVRTSAQQLAQMLNVYANQLTQVRQQQVYDLSDVMINTEFNSIVESIAKLNADIREEYLYGNTPNELMDQRNLLIDQLSNMANIKVLRTADEVADGLFLEHVTIYMYDEQTSASIGLVDHNKCNTLTLNDNGDSVSIAMNTTFRLSETPRSVNYDDITNYFTKGSISGYLDLINGRGDYADMAAGENNYRGIPYYMSQLDTFAKNFAETYNKLNSIQVKDSASISALTSNVAKASGYDSSFMSDYLDAMKGFTFRSSTVQATDPETGELLTDDGNPIMAEVSLSDIFGSADFDSAGIGNLEVRGKDSISFIENYLKEKFPDTYQDMYTIEDVEVDSGDGIYNVDSPAATEKVLKFKFDTDDPSNPINDDIRAALEALTPTALDKSSDDYAAALEAFPAVTDSEGNIVEMTIEVKNLFAPSDGSDEITARNIAISQEWVKDPLFITTTKDPSRPNGHSTELGGTDNVVRMIAAVSNALQFTADPSDPSSSVRFNGTFNEYLVSMGGTLALDVELNANYLETSETLLIALDNSRESVSGVSMDEEATHLMTFQSAYNAAARYFTALDEMIDKLINGTGLVGR